METLSACGTLPWIASCLSIAGLAGAAILCVMLVALGLRGIVLRIMREMSFSRRFGKLLSAGLPSQAATLGLYLDVFPDTIKARGNLAGLMQRQILRLHLLGTDEALVNGVRHLAAQLATLYSASSRDSSSSPPPLASRAASCFCSRLVLRTKGKTSRGGASS